jgi:hypothetical protein
VDGRFRWFGGDDFGFGFSVAVAESFEDAVGAAEAFGFAAEVGGDLAAADGAGGVKLAFAGFGDDAEEIAFEVLGGGIDAEPYPRRRAGG